MNQLVARKGVMFEPWEWFFRSSGVVGNLRGSHQWEGHINSHKFRAIMVIMQRNGIIAGASKEERSGITRPGWRCPR